MVVYFSSSNFNPDSISEKIQKIYDNSIVFGCTTAGEIISGKMLKNSVVVILLSSETIQDVKVEVVENIKTENKIPEIFKNFEQYYKIPMSSI